jgi:hypothetical protein
MGLTLSLAAFWYLVGLQVALVYSPYLTLSADRAYITSGLVTLNSVVVPVVLWLIFAGPPPGRVVSARRGDARDGRRWLVRSSLLTMAFCGVLTAPAALAASRTTPGLSAARRQAAGAIAHGQWKVAIGHLDEMLAIQGGANAELSYLRRRLVEASSDASTIRGAGAER